MMTVLSTKKLKHNQRSLLLSAKFSLVEYDAIHIAFVHFNMPKNIENAIFTSQNAVISFFEKNDSPSSIKKCFCVGEKTKALLEDKGQEVVMMTEYATELADYLIENHKEDSFHFFCGNIRSDEIPTRLKSSNICFEEIKAYNTTINPKKFERRFDAILFFSPSGVRSYCEETSNLKNNSSVFVCIGTTTASEAKNYSQNVVISNSTTVESVIAKAVKILT
ncbi:MAG TPA: uroporphyrinogen-III synthase [Aequorivita sp.]|nr:uroporphyrinogen-III synthase [Aequorivita sp.]